MRKFLKLLLLVFALTVLFPACEPKSKFNETTESKSDITLISPKDLKSFPADAQLIDVRTPGEYNRSHLKNAVNINIYNTNFLTEIGKLDKNREVYLYCQVGNRSRYAAKILSQQGFTKVYDMEGGISNWQKFNYEIESNKP